MLIQPLRWKLGWWPFPELPKQTSPLPWNPNFPISWTDTDTSSPASIPSTTEELSNPSKFLITPLDPHLESFPHRPLFTQKRGC